MTAIPATGILREEGLFLCIASALQDDGARIWNVQIRFPDFTAVSLGGFQKRSAAWAWVQDQYAAWKAAR